MLLLCSHDPKKMQAAARIMLPMGLLVLSCGLAWPHLLAPLFHLTAGQNDFVQGFCMGLGITLEMGAVVAMRVAASRLKQQSANSSLVHSCEIPKLTQIEDGCKVGRGE